MVYEVIEVPGLGFGVRSTESEEVYVVSTKAAAFDVWSELCSMARTNDGIDAMIYFGRLVGEQLELNGLA